MKYQKLSALALSGALIFSMNLTAAAAPVTPEAKQTAGNNDIVILHPNDVHCADPYGQGRITIVSQSTANAA